MVDGLDLANSVEKLFALPELCVVERIDPLDRAQCRAN
jgi:hypothetical protein